MRIIISLILTIIILNPSIADNKKRVILFIGDGFGIAPKTATRMALGQGSPLKNNLKDTSIQILNLDKLRYASTVTTHSLNSWITDSAPGASVYACGAEGKIDNEMISVNPVTLEPVETVLEKAKKAGYAVGIVTTTRVTHATPAAFTSHIWNRDLEEWIAAQMISQNQAEYEEVFNTSNNPIFKYNKDRDWIFPKVKNGVVADVIIGGGLSYFTPKNIESKYLKVQYGTKANKILGQGKRIDDIDLIEIAKNRGFIFCNSRDELLSLDYSQFSIDQTKLLALFNTGHCKYEQDRQTEDNDEPMLAEMVEAAIRVLEQKSPKGYFLMVEGGRIDHLEHANVGGVNIIPENNTYVVESNKPALSPDLTSSKTFTTSKYYGSDYMIKEVLAYDYAVGVGRKILQQTGENFILTTSDHETGGFAVVGLNDENDLQKNKIRTYANEPKKKDFNPNPSGVVRGDIETNGWFPDYTMEKYQNYLFPKANSKRIVIAYGSNPMTNGNSNKLGASPGNHTPQDILLLTDDNQNGKWAGKLTGRGLLDNTQIQPVILEFLGLK